METESQENIVALMGALSAVASDLQQVEQSTLARLHAVYGEGTRSADDMQARFDRVGMLLKDVHDDVQEMRNRLEQMNARLRRNARQERTEEVQ